MTEPQCLTALEARAALAAGSLSAVELVTACLEQVERVDPQVNAMITVAGERALSEAGAVDRRLASPDAVGRAGDGRRALFDRQPLLGLPVAIKDLQATAGIRTTLGSASYTDHVPDVDSGIVARIRAAGGIVIGKTNIPERSIGANTVNRLFGATGNPFDPTLTCGGSSGGSAVALAVDMAPLATGSDHGGSLRIPASYCGVVGFRATPGIVPFEERAISQTFYSVQGPMARTVDDTALLLAVIADRRERSADSGLLGASGWSDPMAFPFDAVALSEVEALDLAELRIGVSADLGGVLVSSAVRAEFARRVDWLADRVGACVEIDLDLVDAAEVDWRLRADVFATYYHREAASWDEGFNPNIVASYEAATATPEGDIAQARVRQMELIRSTESAMINAGVDAVLCPGVGVAPFPWGQLYPAEVDGVPVDNYMAWLTLTAAWSVLGLPVVALPAGSDAQGMAFGVQVVGHRYGDRRTLAVARTLEKVWTDTPFARPRPDLDALAASEVELGPEATAGIWTDGVS